MQAIADFFTAIRTEIPTDVQLAIDPEIPIIDDFSGDAVAFLAPLSVPAIEQPTGTGSYPGPVGASVQWLTDSVKNGRRVRGRTYLVPLSNRAFDNEGTLDEGARTTLQVAANVLVLSTDLGLCVWSRPVNGVGGSSHLVTGAIVADKSAVLRSRRD